ncbi:transmembrane protein 94-like [Rhopilema esculentum]|uniref:transmembrane protein 94-like n=1 Tax=Rhopilema esculentum TaxID=499914 RepID=UPI0031DBC213
MADIELEEIKTNIGLTSTEATRILQNTIKEELKLYDQTTKLQFIHDVINTFYKGKSTPMDWFGASLLFVEAGVLFTGYRLGDENTGLAPLIEGLVVLLCAVFTTVLCVRENRLQHSEVSRNFREAFKRNKDDLQGDTYIDIKCPKSPSITMTGTYRDNKLVNLPWNLLVEGDVVVLGPSETAPTQIKQIVNEKCYRSFPFCLDAGEVFNPPFTTSKVGVEEGNQPSSCQPYPEQMFMVTETPMKRCIRSTFQHCRQRPESVLNHDMRRVLVVLRKKVIWFFLISSLLVNYVRLRLEPATVGHYSEVMLLATGYVLLPLTPIIFPVLWILVSLYGVARIKAAFKHSGIVRTREPNAVWEIDDISLKWTLKEFWKLIRGDPSCLSRTANLLHTLGNVTVFCCIDKLGVLCYPNLTPSKVFMFKNTQSNEQAIQHKRIVRLMSETSDADDMKSSDVDFPEIEVFDNMTIEPYDTEVLNLSYDIKSTNGIQFDDERWKSHIESLKPLGLNLLLNSPCTFPFKRLLQENFTGHISLAANSCPVPNLRRCSCPLAREIGFKDHVLDGFSRYGQIFAFRTVHASELAVIPSDVFLSIVKDKLVPSMVSVVMRENYSGMFQLLTQGSADLVLDACTDFWDGDDLCELSNDERKKALDFYQRMSTTGHCIAFSYRPLIERSCVSFNDDIFIECPPAMTFPAVEMETGSSWSLPKKVSESDETGSNELACIFEEKQESQVVRTDDPQDMLRMLGKQIFIGMVTYSDLVKEDTECLVESLNNGGIRFVYFSTENELKSQVFAERLGLETGWNCHISLANYEPLPCRGSIDESSVLHSETDGLIAGSKSNIAEANDDRRNTAYCSGSEDLYKEKVVNGNSNHDNFYLISNRAKLPRGIRNIRPHLKNVDDVPLRVPLFTDCTPQAVTEMIEIMQENGEVVCCLGSSLNTWNSHIFSQADVSIAIDPLHPQVCVKSKPGNYRSGSPLQSTEDNDKYDVSSLRLSSFLNSLPCSLLCRQDKQIDFVSLICEARRLMFNMKSCFLFMLSANLSLSLCMLVSFCLLLPFPFTGLRLLWLEIIIIPLLSLSLLGTPSDSDLMNRMTGKRISNIYEDSKQFFIHFFPTFGLNVLFTVIGLFAWLLFSFCTKSHGAEGQCHFLFGTKNLTDPWHGWITVNKEGLYMSQDVTLLFTTFYLIVLSASFVDRNYHLWTMLPFRNKLWLKATLLCIGLQFIYTAVSIYLSNVPGTEHDFRIQYVIYPLILALLWPVVLIISCEMMKRRHIKMFIRYQKRERLKFDTKLGMNSPV